ncbi:MAG: ankyrin repeat domain-containing protein [Wolbachia endosymbiont of Fragariocoptes setiger]|nr:ankyrin repeat domain-containing protein [Wolbachia endosymbiont of Fragariocoptes setiger]
MLREEIDAKTNRGYVPLHYACLMNAEGVVRKLVNRENPMNRFDITPMYYATGITRRYWKIKEKNKLREITNAIKKEEK